MNKSQKYWGKLAASNRGKGPKQMGQILCIIDGMTDPYFCVQDLPQLSSMHRLPDRDNTQGREPETMGCVLSLLGVEHIPNNLRGYLEALGSGIAVYPDDLILRGSWYRLDETGGCSVPCAGPRMIHSTAFRYHHLGGYKSLLVFPHMADRICEVATCLPSSLNGATAMEFMPKGPIPLKNAFLQCMSDHRFLVLWGQSIPTALAPFPQRGAAVCGKGLVKGIAKALGMDLVPVQGATGDTDTNLAAKAAAALAAARHYPFVLLHINGADEASHRKNPQEKRAFLKRVDREVLANLLKSGHGVTVVSDHGTDPITGLHLAGGQPVFATHQKGSTRCSNI